MGTEARSVRSTSSCYLRACLIAILVASPAMAWGQSEHRGPSRLTLDGFGLSILDLSAYPDLWYLSAQGNRLRDLDLSGSPRLNRLLLFDNRFDNRSLERLLAEVEGRGQRGGFLGVSSLWKQALSIGGRLDLATLRSRGWTIPTPGVARTFGLQASVYVWEPESFTRRKGKSSWRVADVALEAPPVALPETGFMDDAPRRFYVTDPDGFYDVTSIDLSNKGLVGKAEFQSFLSLFHLNLSYNDLRAVDLSGNRWLTDLDLGDNQLGAIDLSGNPELAALRLVNNDLSSIDLSRNRSLTHLDLRYNRLSSEAVDSILEALVSHGQSGGEVLLGGGGNESPTARGRGASWVLDRRSWKVKVNSEIDFDRDGLGDAWEIKAFGGTHEDAKADSDGDGLSNLHERLQYLDPSKADSDGDGFSDGVELAAATDPLDPQDAPFSNGILEGVVWNDLDRDLVRDEKEAGIPSIEVFLVRGAGVERVVSKTRTLDDGSYRFSQLEADEYSVAIDWANWQAVGPTVVETALEGAGFHEAIDFALFDPAIRFSQWEKKHFELERLAPDADPDGDGYGNLLEYAMGTHPLVSNGRGLPQVEALGDGGDFRLSLRYSIDRNAADVRTVAEAFEEGAWRELPESVDGKGASREVSIPVEAGQLGLIRLRATLIDRPAAVATSPRWGGHALLLQPGTRASGLPLVNSRLFSGRVSRVDATSVSFASVDLPLARLLGNERSYLEVMEGPFEGERWEVAGEQPFPDRISLAVNHDANTRRGALPDLVGRAVVIRPHLTLGQVFGYAGERALHASAIPDKADRIWFLEEGRLTPYHFAASDDGLQTMGWSRWGDLTRFWDDRPIFPGEGFFVHRLGQNGIVLFLVGEVRENRMVMPLVKGMNFMAAGFPSRESLFGLGLNPQAGLAAGLLPDDSSQAFFWNGRGYDSYYLFGNRRKQPRWIRIDDAKSVDGSLLPLIGGDVGFLLDLLESRRIHTRSTTIGLW